MERTTRRDIGSLSAVAAYVRTGFWVVSAISTIAFLSQEAGAPLHGWLPYIAVGSLVGAIVISVLRENRLAAIIRGQDEDIGSLEARKTVHKTRAEEAEQAELLKVQDLRLVGQEMAREIAKLLPSEQHQPKQTPRAIVFYLFKTGCLIQRHLGYQVLDSNGEAGCTTWALGVMRFLAGFLSFEHFAVEGLRFGASMGPTNLEAWNAEKKGEKASFLPSVRAGQQWLLEFMNRADESMIHDFWEAFYAPKK